jgi:RNA polymerase sigma-70 factor (ECF subfamily)
MMDAAETLTERAQRGDPEALSALLRESEPDLRRFAARVCRSAADADDAVAHAMSTLAVKLDSFRGASRLSTWIFTVIRNECSKYERIARRWIFGEPDAPSPSATPEQSLDRAQTLDVLVRAIRALRPELREVFVLRELEELSTEDCAARLAITEANVKVRLHRARVALREAIEAQR